MHSAWQVGHSTLEYCEYDMFLFSSTDRVQLLPEEDDYRSRSPWFHIETVTGSNEYDMENWKWLYNNNKRHMVVSNGEKLHETYEDQRERRILFYNIFLVNKFIWMEYSVFFIDFLYVYIIISRIIEMIMLILLGLLPKVYFFCTWNFLTVKRNWKMIIILSQAL